MILAPSAAPANKLSHLEFDEPLYEQEALRRVLVRKGLVTNEEVLEEVKTVRRELEKKRGR